VKHRQDIITYLHYITAYIETKRKLSKWDQSLYWDPVYVDAKMFSLMYIGKQFLSISLILTYGMIKKGLCE